METWFFTAKIRRWLYGGSNWSGQSSFTTTGLTKAITVTGVTASDIAFAIPAATVGAGEFLGAVCTTDTVTVNRLTGTTSGLVFNWFVIRTFTS